MTVCPAGLSAGYMLVGNMVGAGVYLAAGSESPPEHSLHKDAIACIIEGKYTAKQRSAAR